MNKTYIAQYHHYYQASRIATQFCKIVPTKDKELRWGASHDDIYEMIEKITKATTYYRSLPKNILILENKRGVIDLGIIYPALLFSGQIYEYNIDGSLKECDHLLLCWKIKSKTVAGSFYIDVMKESYLPTYLKIIHEEHDSTVSYLRENIEILRKNVYTDFKRIIKEEKSKGPYRK